MTSTLAGPFPTPKSRRSLRLEAEAHVGRATEMMGRARALVDGDRIDAADLLTARRDALARHLQRYQRFKHGRIFDPVVAHGATSSVIVARSMKVDCLQLGEVFGAYHARWRRLPPHHWHAYRHDMLETTAMLAWHLEAELRAIRQLLAISTFYGRSMAA